MEFPFEVKSLFPNPITRVVAGKLPVSSSADGSFKNHGNHFEIVVNKMGKASSQAQGLRSPITSYEKIVASKHILYIMTDHGGQRGTVVGILKVGRKRLFLTDFRGLVHEVEPLCVLDFYVHESCQRCGYGKQLFEEMLKTENVKSCEVAIDRPSPKFLGFLKKHYKLSSFVEQGNKFVVFNEFFQSYKVTESETQCITVTSQPTDKLSPPSARLASGTHPKGSLQNRLWSTDNLSSPKHSSLSLGSTSGTPLSGVSPNIRRWTMDNSTPPFAKSVNPLRAVSGNHPQVSAWHWQSVTPSPQRRRSEDKPSPFSLLAVHTPGQSSFDTQANPSSLCKANHLSPWSVKSKQTLSFSLSPKQRDFDIITGKEKKKSNGNRESGRPGRLSDSQVPSGGASFQQTNEAVQDRAPHLNMRAKKRRVSWQTPLGAINEQSRTLKSQLAKYSHHTRI